MVTQLSPKAQFQNNEDMVKEFRSVISGHTMQTALTYAISEYSTSCKPTTEELNGVRRFIYELLNLSEKEGAPPTFPTRRLGQNSQPTTSK